MAAADCPICEAMGYRSCDRCGTPIFDVAALVEGEPELCGYCLHPTPAKPSSGSEGRKKGKRRTGGRGR